jgi:hypothetical protein
MEDGIDRGMMDAHQDYACMLQNKRIFVHISQEKYILTEDVKKDKTTGCYKLADECLHG